ncbi:hypothetical protein [uncultured Propionivibrio sp.]|uniref:hypothetical protein n=1 Tax=uncultured Propionivibrio sp. TaxID=426737 RepID=UPI0029C02B22|nr:hypothetical protein [uncultured Propionivibrio sp.]
MYKIGLLLVTTVSVLAGCGTANTSVYPPSGHLLPNAAVKLTPSTTLSFEQLLLGGAIGTAIYLVYDPLAPNWNIEERAVNGDTYELSLRAKSFRIGGDGEAYQILKRRASTLQQSRGYSGYRILNYSEGIESSTPMTHRVGSGTIQLVRLDGGAPR